MYCEFFFYILQHTSLVRVLSLSKGTMKKKQKYIVILLLTAAVLWNVYWNRSIVVHTYVHQNADIPQSFDGFRVVQLTDLHSVRSEKQKNLIYTKTKEQKPDLICITGDLVDSSYYATHGVQGEGYSLELIEELTQLARICFVYGNHEMILLDDPEHNAYKVALEEAGVQFLNHEVMVCSSDENEHIYIAGIQDPSTLYKDLEYAYYDTNAERMEAMLDEVTKDRVEEEFVLLLSHRPEYFELYDQYPIDLCLTGHAHGGQFRIPFVGGIYAPGQGFFPKYTAGCFETEDMQMYVGTGIGNSAIPVRIFNPPEILTIVLEWI